MLTYLCPLFAKDWLEVPDKVGVVTVNLNEGTVVEGVEAPVVTVGLADIAGDAPAWEADGKGFRVIYISEKTYTIKYHQSQIFLNKTKTAEEWINPNSNPML